MRNTSPHSIIRTPQTSDAQKAIQPGRDLNRILYGGEIVPEEQGAGNGLGNAPDPNSGSILTFPIPIDSIPVGQLQRLRDEWLLAAGRSQHTARTIGEKRNISDKLLWFVAARDYRCVGLSELEAFFNHLTSGHNTPKGRFDNAGTDVRAKKPLRPVTVLTYYAYLKGFWTWLDRRGFLQENPFKILDKPKAKRDQIEPFTDDQIEAFLRAAKDSACPHRNTAIIMFLLDTGVRASEMCSIRLGDVDFSDEKTLRIKVLGKGEKYRTLRLSPTASMAMWTYFKSEHGLERYYKNRTASKRRRVDPKTPLFITAHRAREGQPLTRGGLRLLIRDLGEAAGIGAIACTTKTFRHTFAIKFLRNGGDPFTLRDMMGHEDLTTTQIYLSIALSDTEAQHAKFSPVESVVYRR